MAIEIKVQQLPESVSEATIAAIHKSVGDSVSVDENIADLETEKIVLEMPSTVDGVIKEIRFQEGDTVVENDVIVVIEEGAASSDSAPKAESTAQATTSDDADKLSPAVAKMLNENNIDPASITGTGRDGRLLKEDVQNHLSKSTI